MLAEADGKDVADELLRRPVVSDGFARLVLHARETGNQDALKLAVEYLVLQQPWRELFTDDQLAVARQRLIDGEVDPATVEAYAPDLGARDKAKRIARYERERSPRSRRLRDLPPPHRAHPRSAKLVQREGWWPLVLCDHTGCYWNRSAVRDKDGVVHVGTSKGASEYLLTLIQSGRFGEEIKDAYDDHVRWEYIYDDLIDQQQPELIAQFTLRELDLQASGPAKPDTRGAASAQKAEPSLPGRTLSNLTSVNAVLVAIREFDAIGRDAFLEKYGFGPAREYFLEYNDERYDSKAIVGAAFGYQFPELGPLKSDEFSGGEATVAATLTGLGFTIARASGAPAPTDGTAWSVEEVAATVSAYFTMLELELRGEAYSKKDHNRRLQPLLSNRSPGAIEFKHANISAILIELGFPYIDGYKPRGNYQELLRTEIEVRLAQSTVLAQVAESALLAPATTATHEHRIEEVFVAPPDREEGQAVYERRVTAPRKGTDYLELETRNRSLGTAGELFVLELEQRRLWEAGHRDLAGRIDHVSTTRGDGLGYDIMSFETDGREKLIEVKTTRLGKMTPFYASRTEVAVSEERAAQFRLYRVFKFRESPKVFVLNGALRDSCLLDPIQFRAAFR